MQPSMLPSDAGGHVGIQVGTRLEEEVRVPAGVYKCAYVWCVGVRVCFAAWLVSTMYSLCVATEMSCYVVVWCDAFTAAQRQPGVPLP
jgi:hypothetical protein